MAYRSHGRLVAIGDNFDRPMTFSIFHETSESVLTDVAHEQLFLLVESFPQVESPVRSG
jgi:hypothetical protein